MPVDRDEAGDLERAGNPCVFIVGCLRSGTTVFRNLVDAHPLLSIVNETQWLPRLWEHREHAQNGLTPEGTVTPAVLPVLLAHERVERLGLDADELRNCLEAAGAGVTYSEFVRTVFDEYGRKHQKPFVGEKSPGYVRHLPTLHRLWPRARVVHLVRDGRDVCLSLMAWKPEKIARTVGRFSTWTAEPVITAALWWEWHVRLGLEARRHLGEQYYALRYEDVVRDSERVALDLCTFLGVTYDSRMLRYYEGATTSPPTRGSASPLKVGLRDWRTQLAPDRLMLFEAAAGGLLDELGYQRVTSPSADVGDLVADVRRRFQAEATARRRRVPEWSSMP